MPLPQDIQDAFLYLNMPEDTPTYLVRLQSLGKMWAIRKEINPAQLEIRFWAPNSEVAAIEEAMNKVLEYRLALEEKFAAAIYYEIRVPQQTIELIEQGLPVNTQDNNSGYSPAHLAARYYNIPLLEFLIAKKANLNLLSKNNMPPLAYAMDSNIIQLLVENGANLLFQNGAILHKVVSRGYLSGEQIYKLLQQPRVLLNIIEVFDNNLPINKPALNYLVTTLVRILNDCPRDAMDLGQLTVLLLNKCLQFGDDNLSLLELTSQACDIYCSWSFSLFTAKTFEETLDLIKAGASLFSINEAGDYAFVVACKKYPHLANFLMEQSLRVLSYEDNPNYVILLHIILEYFDASAHILFEGFSAAHVASAYNHFPLMYFLLNKGIDSNQHSQTNGITPLFLVRNVEMLRLLLEHGANSLAKNNYGQTALEYLFAQQILSTKTLDLQTLKCLIENAPANINSQAEILIHCLNFLVFQEHSEVLANCVNELSQYSLEECNQEGVILSSLLNEQAKTLLSSSKQDWNTQLALELDKKHEASLEMIYSLLQNGAHVDTQGPDSGWTSLHVATKLHNSQLVEWLVNHNANLNLKTTCGHPPLAFASYQMGLFLQSKGALIPSYRGQTLMSSPSRNLGSPDLEGFGEDFVI